MKRIVSLAVLAILLLMRPAPSFAQSSPNLTDDEAVKIARAFQELELRRAEVATLKEALGAQDRRAAALESALTACERAAAKWKEAATERTTANGLDAKIEASYRESVERYEAELARTREQRDSARRSRWAFATVALVVGLAIGVVAAKD